MNTTIKRLLQVEPKALKALYKVFRIDWMKPYTAIEIRDNFTVKSAFKAIEATKDDLVIVLTQDPNSYWNKEEFNVVQIYSDGKFDNEFQERFFSSDCRNIDTYTRKSDFDEVRKKKGIFSIVIKQNKKYLSTTPTKHTTDLSQRFKLINSDRAIEIHYTSNHTPYIDKINLIETVNTGKKYTYHVHSNWYGKPYTTNASDIIDKSGYIVEIKRQELKRKATVLKAERDKAAFMEVDNSRQIEELKQKIASKKVDLINRLTAADNSEMLEQVGKAIGEAWYKGFSSIVREFEKMQKACIDKTYRSIDEFNNHYNDITAKLQKI